jgi:hypothetical protein
MVFHVSVCYSFTPLTICFSWLTITPIDHDLAGRVFFWFS